MKFKIRGNNSGIALVMVLILCAIVLSFTAGVLYLVTQSTVTSGAGKRFTTSMEASLGGVDIIKQVIDDRGIFTGTIAGTSSNCDTNPKQCLCSKLQLAKSDWTIPANGGYCSTSSPDNLSPNVKADPDMTFALGDYTVEVKIVDTRLGNSGDSGNDVSVGGGVGTGIADAGPPIPYLYTILVRASKANTNELSDFTVEYAY